LALAFFLTGTRQALGVVGVLAVGADLLVGINASSTARMRVASRRDDIQVIRATGGTARSVVGLFGLRSGLLGAVGVALGYALGVITANAAVNTAVAIGLPMSLSVAVTRELATLLVPALLGVWKSLHRPAKPDLYKW